jgi:hypothetical protein
MKLPPLIFKFSFDFFFFFFFKDFYLRFCVPSLTSNEADDTCSQRPTDAALG